MPIRMRRSPMMHTRVTPTRTAGVNVPTRFDEASSMNPRADRARHTTTKPALAWALTSEWPLVITTNRAR